jgi:hypothetical protein
LTVGTTNNLDELGFAESVRRASVPGFLGLAQNLVDRLKRVGAQVVFHRRPGTWGSFDPSLEMEVSGYRDIREVEHVLISREGSKQEAHMLFAHGTVGGKDMLVRWESDRPMNVLALRSELDELGFKGSAFSLDRLGGSRVVTFQEMVDYKRKTGRLLLADLRDMVEKRGGRMTERVQAMPGSWGKLSMEDLRKILPRDSPSAHRDLLDEAENWARNLGIWVEKPGRLTIQSSPGPMEQVEDQSLPQTEQAEDLPPPPTP